MSLEMSDRDQGICHIDLTGDGDRFENGFVDPNLCGVISPQAICDQNRSIDNRLCESIFKSGGEMRYRLAPGSGIEGVGIG